MLPPLCGTAQNTAKYPAVWRSACHYQKLPGLKVHCAKDEKLGDGGNGIWASDPEAVKNWARVSAEERSGVD